MRRRLLPSLTALRAFEAVARHMSFTEAAVELNVTQSAASRQVRTLEEALGTALFIRAKKGLELTEEGRVYAQELKEALDRMELATLQAATYEKGGGVLTIGVLPTFCTRWLIPRLSSFYAAHPKITLNMISSDGPLDLSAGGFDLALRYGTGDWPGLTAYRLPLSETMVVVCSPDLMNGPHPLNHPRDLRHHTLLRHSTREGVWRQWLREADVDGVDPDHGPGMEHFFMVIQAVLAGLGVALLPRFLIEDELAVGTLISPFDTSIVCEGGYYLICYSNRSALPKIKSFRSWIFAEMNKGS
jgi:DNA-binding transcriptional LysR family regulator